MGVVSPEMRSGGVPRELSLRGIECQKGRQNQIWFHMSARKEFVRRPVHHLRYSDTVSDYGTMRGILDNYLQPLRRCTGISLVNQKLTSLGFQE